MQRFWITFFIHARQRASQRECAETERTVAKMVFVSKKHDKHEFHHIIFQRFDEELDSSGEGGWGYCCSLPNHAVSLGEGLLSFIQIRTYIHTYILLLLLLLLHTIFELKCHDLLFPRRPCWTSELDFRLSDVCSTRVYRPQLSS